MRPQKNKPSAGDRHQPDVNPKPNRKMTDADQTQSDSDQC